MPKEINISQLVQVLKFDGHCNANPNDNYNKLNTILMDSLSKPSKESYYIPKA